MRRFSYTIKEEQGIHARPASFLIQEARTYESRITIRVKGKEADASNIIAVMALDVVCGQRVEVEICGTDEGVAYRLSLIHILYKDSEVRSGCYIL